MEPLVSISLAAYHSASGHIFSAAYLIHHPGSDMVQYGTGTLLPVTCRLAWYSGNPPFPSEFSQSRVTESFAR
jgi:hypothetical protein